MTRCRTWELRGRTESGRLAPAILAKNIGKIYNIDARAYESYVDRGKLEGKTKRKGKKGRKRR